MRVFEKGNWNAGHKCPICKTSKEGKVVLVTISGTEEGHIAQAEQVHLDCLELTRGISTNGAECLYQEIK